MFFEICAGTQESWRRIWTTHALRGILVVVCWVGTCSAQEASEASDDQTLTPEERTRGCSHFIELWTAQMDQSFPGVPLYCQTFAT